MTMARGCLAGALCGLTLLTAGCASAPGSGQAATAASTATATGSGKAVSAGITASGVPASTAAASPVATCPGSAPPTIAQGTGTVPALASIEFVSASQGWVAGAGRILVTSNGGQSWQTQYSGQAKLDQIDFIDATHGWAVGTNELLTTDDGGASWISLPEPCGYIQSVHFVTPAVGYAISGGSDIRLDGGLPTPVTGGELLMTTDGGQQWLPVRGAPAHVQTVCFSSTADGFLGTPGAIWRSTDGGGTWSRSFSEPAQPGYSQHEPGDTAVLECAGNTAAWALFLGFGAAMNHAPYIAYTTQDATNWHVLFEENYIESAVMPEVHAPEGPGSYPGPFSAISPDTAAFLGWTPPVGLGGVAPLDMVTDGGHLTQEGDVGGLSQAYDAAFISAAQGWVVGTDQTEPGKAGNDVIEATADGGRTWTLEYQADGNG
jgi:photosystem II stability/assembly factor-like uncharacterized protein